MGILELYNFVIVAGAPPTRINLEAVEGENDEAAIGQICSLITCYVEILGHAPSGAMVDLIAPEGHEFC